MREGVDRKRFVRAWHAATILGIVAAVAVGCGGGSSTPKKLYGCTQVDAPSPKSVSYEAPKQTVKKGEKLTAVVKTNCGSFDIALDTRRAPKTTNSLAFLAEHGFYDDLTFHRLASGFVIQGGDPLGTGTGGPGYSVVEPPPANLAYTKGLVAMAKSSAEPSGTSGSQFFVVLGVDIGLPPEYALVGKVDKGLDVVNKLNGLGTPMEKPKLTILIESITIEKG